MSTSFSGPGLGQCLRDGHASKYKNELRDGIAVMRSESVVDVETSSPALTASRAPGRAEVRAGGRTLSTCSLPLSTTRHPPGAYAVFGAALAVVSSQAIGRAIWHRWPDSCLPLGSMARRGKLHCMRCPASPPVNNGSMRAVPSNCRERAFSHVNLEIPDIEKQTETISG